MTTQPEALRLAEILEGGSRQFNAEAAAELRRLHQHEVALSEWLDKTSWLQETARPGELGMHRADAMRARMLKAEAQRGALLYALKGVLAWGTDENWKTANAWCEKARAAIAKAEGA